MRRLLFALLIAVPAYADTHTVRVIELERFTQIKIADAETSHVDRVLPDNFPLVFEELMDTLEHRNGDNGVVVREIYRDRFDAGGERTYDKLRVRLGETSKSDALVVLHVPEHEKDFELHVPINQTVIVSGDPTAVRIQLFAVSVMDDAAAASVPELFKVTRETKAPVVVRHVDAVYPEDARQKRISGIVIIQAEIDENGDVVAAWVIKDIPELRESALSSVKKKHFLPAQRDGKPVRVLFNLTVSYRLT